MPKIAFFSNHFARNDGTGITRYARSLVSAFAGLNTPHRLVPVATWSNTNRDELTALQAESGLQLMPTGRWLTPLLWRSIQWPPLERMMDGDVEIVHGCYLGYLPATTKPLVVTVHDIGPLTHPNFFMQRSTWNKRKNLDVAVKKGAVFICVSQTTAESLQEYVWRQWSVDLAPRTHVVHEGVSDRFRPASNGSTSDFPGVPGLPAQPYLLAVGKISPRKNFGAVVKALQKLQSTIPHHLVAVGGDGWDYQEVKDLVKSAALEDRVHFLGYVSDEKLLALYRRAALFVFPSLFEGFGLPVLEAMAAGCPVITSECSSLPEVAGDAALLVDPHDVDGLAAAIEAVCCDRRRADELRAKGLRRASHFSWQKCARETAQVYDTLLS